MLTRAAIVSAVLFVAALATAGAGRTDHVVPARPLSQFPLTLGVWAARDGGTLDRSIVAALGVDDVLNRVYTHAARPPVALYVGYYASQRQGDTMHSPLNCLPGAGWEPVRRTRTTLHIRPSDRGERRREVVVNHLLIRKAADRQVVLYWYQGQGRVVASEYWGRALLVFDALRRQRTDGALVRVISPVATTRDDEETAAAAAAVSFATSVVPALDGFLPR